MLLFLPTRKNEPQKNKNKMILLNILSSPIVQHILIGIVFLAVLFFLNKQFPLLTLPWSANEENNDDEYELPANAKLLFKDTDFESYDDHPAGGLLIETKDELYLNNELLYKGSWDEYETHPNGVVVTNGNKLFVNQTLVYEGEYEGHRPHPQGLLIETEEGVLFINNRKVFEGEYEDYSSHKDGIVLEINDNLYLVRC